MAAAFRCEQRIAADEYACVEHLRRLHGNLIAEMIAVDLDFPERDDRWITPWNINVSDLTHASYIGGFGSSRWILQGWILDDSSMVQLRQENPKDPRLVAPIVA